MCGVRKTFQACSAPLGGERGPPVDCNPSAGCFSFETLGGDVPEAILRSGLRTNHRVTPMATLHPPVARFTADRGRLLRARGPAALAGACPPGPPARWLNETPIPLAHRPGAHRAPGT